MMNAEQKPHSNGLIGSECQAPSSNSEIIRCDNEERVIATRVIVDL
jgi:hypothetical protein